MVTTGPERCLAAESEAGLVAQVEDSHHQGERKPAKVREAGGGESGTAITRGEVSKGGRRSRLSPQNSCP